MCSFNDNFKEESYVTFGPSSTKALNELDNKFKGWALEYGGLEYRIPSLIDEEVLEKTGYFESFPQHLTAVATFTEEYYKEGKANTAFNINQFRVHRKFLTPAACLHIYPTLKNELIKDNKVITTLARVYRYEEGKFEDMTRLWDFTVREMVFIGNREDVTNKLEEIKKKTLEYANKIGLIANLVKASDYFYPSKKNRRKAMVQIANDRKSELQVQIGERTVAIASFNFHDYHFSNTFDFSNEGKIVTGCVGFGLERWIAALNQYNVSFENLLKESE